MSDNNTSQTYSYDNLLRTQSVTEKVADNKSLTKTISYDSNSNLISTKYSNHSGDIVTEHYIYSNGHHIETKLNGTTSIWKLTSESDMGMPTASITGSLNRTYSYDIYGLPTARSIKKGNNTLQDFQYQFNPTTGNLSWRTDQTRDIREDFLYDNLNRLTHFGGKVISYDNKGNIETHSEIGSFGYSTVKPYAVEFVDTYGKHIPLREQQITYNAQMRPVTIRENDYLSTLSYDANGNRVKMHLKKGDADELIRYYIGGQYEIDKKVGEIEERLYLDGDAYSAAAVYVKKGSGSWQVYYIGRDYLGSITHLMDSEGNLMEEYSYDPWGRLRNPDNQTLYETDKSPALFLSRGYTGHEHLPMFGLINMNARLYDPVVGRFLSPDPYVQAPDFSQNFNRYSYALNNPLRYTDPNGEFIHLILGGLSGGVFNLVYKFATGQINSWQDGLMAFGIGAAAGVLGAATGGAAFLAAGGGAAGAGGFIAGAWGGIMGYMSSAPLQNLGNHFYFGDPLMSVKDHAIGLGISGLTGGLGNGVLAKINNKNVWTGDKIQPGRNAFSIKNTPKIQAPAKVEPLGQQLLNAPKPKIDNLVARVTPNGNSFTIDYDVNYHNPSNYSLDGKINLSRPNINGYNSTLDLKTDLYHNFPKEFDKIVVKHGNWANR